MMVDRTASDPEPLTYIIQAVGIQKKHGNINVRSDVCGFDVF